MQGIKELLGINLGINVQKATILEKFQSLHA